MKKILSLLTLSTTLTAGVIGISSCGLNGTYDSFNNKKYYRNVDINIDYDEIFYTPTFQMEDEDGNLQPYINEKYNNKLFFYSTYRANKYIKEFPHRINYDSEGYFYPDDSREEIHFIESIVDSVTSHEIFLKNKEKLNNFEFIDWDNSKEYKYNSDKIESKLIDLYNSLNKPSADKWKSLNEESEYNHNYKGNAYRPLPFYHLNIKHNNLTCTINAKANIGGFDKMWILPPATERIFAGPERNNNWTFSVDKEQCGWFNEDVKKRLVITDSNGCAEGIEIKEDGLWEKHDDPDQQKKYIQYLKIMNREPIIAQIDNDGNVYDDLFAENKRERVLIKDFWVALDKDSDSEAFSPQETVNPRGIKFSKGTGIDNHCI